MAVFCVLSGRQGCPEKQHFCSPEQTVNELDIVEGTVNTFEALRGLFGASESPEKGFSMKRYPQWLIRAEESIEGLLPNGVRSELILSFPQLVRQRVDMLDILSSR